MTRYTILAAPLAGLATPAPALADSAETWRDGFGHMWGGGFGMVGGVMMLLFWRNTSAARPGWRRSPARLSGGE